MTSSRRPIASGSSPTGKHNSRMLHEAQCVLSSKNAMTFGGGGVPDASRMARTDALWLGMTPPSISSQSISDPAIAFSAVAICDECGKLPHLDLDQLGFARRALHCAGCLRILLRPPP